MFQAGRHLCQICSWCCQVELSGLFRDVGAVRQTAGHQFESLSTRLLRLQGDFNAGEPVTAIFDWLTESLRHPGLTYELMLPARRPLVASLGRVRDVDLMPQALLHFRWEPGQNIAQGMPALNDAALCSVDGSL